MSDSDYDIRRGREREILKVVDEFDLRHKRKLLKLISGAKIRVYRHGDGSRINLSSLTQEQIEMLESFVDYVDGRIPSEFLLTMD